MVVAGVPIGDEEFVANFLDDKVSGALSKMNTVVDKLRDAHLQSLFCAARLGLAPLIDHLLQHCSPRQTARAAATFDEALLDVVRLCIPGLRAREGVTVSRVRMPPRHFGLGFRSRVTLAPICFASCVCRVLPRMLDSSDLQGAHKAGFLPQLAPLLGVGSFDAGVRLRFAHFLGASSSLGNDFQTAWDDLRAQLPPDPEGLLALEAAAGGGADTDHLQRRLTSELERHWAQVLDVACRGLPAEDVRRSAWMNLDTFSTVWVSCWPHKDAYLSNEEFVEVATRYMGLPSPSCEISAGEPIGNTRSVLDRFGMRLSTATLPGDGWRVQHDSILWRLVEDCREMGVPVQPEVYGLFASCLPQPAAQQFRDLPVRQRQGLVPDLLCTLQWDVRLRLLAPRRFWQRG